MADVKTTSGIKISALLLCLLFAIVAGAPARAQFASAWTSAEADRTNDAAWGDMDGDGDADLLACNYSQPTRVYRNDGGGAFTLLWSSPGSPTCKRIAWGDYDRDGDLDFVEGNYNLANRVYRNNGNGTFTYVWGSTEVENTYSVVWGDYDNDGDPDILAANYGQSNRLYRNDGGGAFTLAWSSVETDNSYGAAWGDYDGDGDLDQLIANIGLSCVYRNDGADTFTLVWSAPQTDSSVSAAWGDSDGDGDPDILLGNISNKANRVYRNDGGGAFTLAWYSAETDNTFSIAWGDYDNDGDLDQLAGNYSATTNRVYRNDGSNTFTLAWNSTETEETYDAAWADMDGDGDLDFAAANYNQANRIYQNTLNPGNAAPGAPAATAEPDGYPGLAALVWTAPADDHTPAALLGYHVRVGTCPGCGDVVSERIIGYPGNGGSGQTLFSVHLAAGTYYWSVAALDTTGAASPWSAEDSFVLDANAYISQWTSIETDASSSAAAGDYDNDGDNDVLVGANGQNRVYRNDGPGAFSLVWSSPQADVTNAVAWGDMDGDGDLDQLIGNNGVNRVYRNDGAGAFSLIWTSTDADTTTSVAWGDYDSDGDLDQLIGNYGANRIYKNNGGGAFSLVWSSIESENTNSVAWGDFDNDGDLDQLAGNDGANRVYINDGAGAFTLIWTSTETDNTNSIAWGDYDSDGDLDQYAGNNGANRIYRNDGAGAFTLIWSSTETDNTTAAGLGDYDGDGDLDLIAANDGQANRLYKNNGGGAFALEWTSPETEASRGLALADYDGDGDMDQFTANNGAAARVYRDNMNPLNTAPIAPALTAEPDGTEGAFTLQWTATTDDHTPAAALGYQVRIGTTPGGGDVVSGAFAGRPNAAATSFNITLPAGTYYWAARAVDNTGPALSAWSAEDSFVALGPDIVAPAFAGLSSVTGCGGGCLELSWTAASDAPHNSTPISYRVYKSTVLGAFNFASPYAETTGTTVQINSLINDTAYYFVVRARDALGNEDTNTVEMPGVPAASITITKYPYNPVLSGDGTGFDADGVGSPEVYYDGSIYRMWYDGRVNNTLSGGYAISNDGVNWARIDGPLASGAVMEKRGDGVSFDSLAAASGKVMANPPSATNYAYFMWYGGVREDNPNSLRMGLARSSDGLNWERVAGSGEGGAMFDWSANGFDGYAAYTPSIIYENGQYKLWYTGSAVDLVNFDYDYRIGLATSNDGLNWIKYAGPGPLGALMDMGAPGSFDALRATHPNVYKENSVYKMFYSGWDGTKYRIGFAVSPDGIQWTKQPGGGPGGSVLNVGAQYDTVIAARSSLQVINGTRHLWYEGYDGTAYVIMYANDSGVMPPKLTGITVSAAPAAVRVGETAAFTATCAYTAAHPSCGATSCECTDAVAWSSGNAAVATITQAGGTATGVATGTANITATAAGITSSPIALNVTQDPVVMITSPVDGAIVSGTVAVNGTVNHEALDQWTLSYGPGPSPVKWRVLATGTTNVADAILTDWNTYPKSGFYTLKLFASSTYGFTAQDTVTVFVRNRDTVTHSITKNKWVLLSVPLHPDNTSPAAMFGDTNDYKVYRWDPLAESRTFLDRNVYPEVLDAGYGYWYKTFDKNTTISYSGYLADTTQDFVLPIFTGWNQIGTPFFWDFSWDLVKVRYLGVDYTVSAAAAAGIISETIQGYDGVKSNWVQYGPVATLVKGLGYEVRAYVDCELLFDPNAGQPDALLRVVRPVFDYKIKLEVQAPDAADTYNYFGTSADSESEFDRHDVEEPPLAPGDAYISLYFPREDWYRNPARYANDIRATARSAGQSEEWTFNVETNQTGAAVTLSWNNTALPSERYTFTLVNLDNGDRIDMAGTNAYTFTPASGDVAETHFRIEVAFRETAQQAVTHTLEPGWNLISAPMDPLVTAALDQLGDDLPLLNVFQYHDGKFYNAGAADIQAGLAYWVYVENNTEIDITGLPVTTQLRVPLAAGWNLIGNPFTTPLTWDDSIQFLCSNSEFTLSQSIAEGITDGKLYLFQGDSYAPANGSLQPWKGYMLKMSHACDLVLNPPGN